MDGGLTGLINKLDNENIAGLTGTEQMQLFNALKYLDMYQKIGTIAEFMDLKNSRKHKSEMG